MHTLPRFPDEEQLKRQAKELLRAHRAGDPTAQQRFTAHAPCDWDAAGTDSPRLAHALLIIAREYGFASWPKLKAHIATVRAAQQQRWARAVARLARKADHDRMTAERSTALIAHAQSGATGQLAATFSRLPRGEIEAVRASLLARDDGSYDVLVAALISGLRHQSARVRYGCAGALDHFGDNQAIVPLQALLDDPVPRVRRMALHALSCEACKLTPLPDDTDLVALLADHALNDLSINVRRHAVYGLTTRCDDPRAAAALDRLRREEADPTIVRTLRRAKDG